MAKWSGIKHRLEYDFLAESLKGHIQYYVTTYSRSPDHEGRAAILFDRKEILSGNYYNQWLKAHLLPHDDKYQQRICGDNPFTDETAINFGMFDQRSFYSAFDEFCNQSIDKSLVSKNMLVKIFALMDRRVGKRRLKAMKFQMAEESPVIQMFYKIRTEAENM